MDDRKSDPNPTPDPAPAEEEKAREEAEPVTEAAEDSEEEEFVEEDDDDDDEEGEEFEHVSEFAPPPRNPRTPFTNLSQFDADLALARTLQEQERAYMMLTIGAGGRTRDSVGSESGSEYELHYEDEGDGDHPLGEHSSVDDSDYDEDAFDAQGTQDPTSGVEASAFDNDEAFARALQDAEEREVAARLMAFAGINDWVAEDARDYVNNTQDTWSDVDPDELSYEELVALGEAVGTASRGLTADTIASLPSVSYEAQNVIEGSNDQCVICRLDYEDGDSLILLSCEHKYHPECINRWLQINKVCPICNAEVSTSENR